MGYLQIGKEYIGRITMSHLTVSQISSIGWLNCADGSINLTPCLYGKIEPLFVNVTKDQYKATKGDKDLMKALALQVFNEPK